MARWETALGKAMIPAERKWLKDTAARLEREFGSIFIVNIGIFRGASLYCLRAGAPNAHLYGIDIQYPQGEILDKDLRCEVILADSGRCHTLFEHPVHMLFVDGDHSYEAVKADITGWSPKIVPDGVIAFHDFAPEPKVAKKHEGIKRAVLEWERDAQWQLIPSAGSLRAYRSP